jgi:hypothetical protein
MPCSPLSTRILFLPQFLHVFKDGANATTLRGSRKNRDTYNRGMKQGVVKGGESAALSLGFTRV